MPCALRFRYANVGYTSPVGITQAITAHQDQRQSNFRTELASISRVQKREGMIRIPVSTFTGTQNTCQSENMEIFHDIFSPMSW